MKQWFIELDLLNRGSRRTFLFAHLGIFLLCFLFTVAYVLGSNVVSFVKKNLIGSLPQHELLVEVKKVEMAMFRMDAPDANKLTPESLETMKHLKGVTAVLPIKYATAPVAVEGSFLGQQFGSKMVLQGFDPRWLETEFELDKLTWQPGKEIPVVINSQILAIYNNGFAKAAGYPELSAAAIINQKFTIAVGDEQRGVSRMKARVVGLSTKVGLGVCIPNSALEALHEPFQGTAPVPVQAVLRVGQIADVDAVKAAVDELGFFVVEPPALVKAINRTASIGAAFGWFGAILLMVIAISYLNQTVKMLFYLKRGDYAMCRAMGMDRMRLRGLLISEMLLWVGIDVALASSFGIICVRIIHKTYIQETLLRLTGFAMEIQVPVERLAIFALALLVASAASLMPRIYFDTRRYVGAALKAR